MTAAQKQKKVIVTQIRSSIRHDARQKRTLDALGLGRIGKKKEHHLNPAVRGMIQSVAHFVVVKEIA